MHPSSRTLVYRLAGASKESKGWQKKNVLEEKADSPVMEMPPQPTQSRDPPGKTAEKKERGWTPKPRRGGDDQKTVRENPKGREPKSTQQKKNWSMSYDAL